MEISGTIVKDMGVVKGVSQAGNEYQKHEFLIEQFGMYPKYALIQTMGAKVETIRPYVVVGKQVTCHVNIESREWNERFFTSISAWKVESYVSESDRATQQAPAASNVGTNTGTGITPSGNDEDLPF